jgi:hypothetical protein
MTFLIKELIAQSVKEIKIVTAPSQTKLILDLITCTDN